MTEQATVIRWENPPPARGGTSHPASSDSSRYNTIAAQLRARPGDWALIEDADRENNSGLATKISMGHMLCFTPAGDFEAVTRRRHGVFRTYARYLGDGGA